MLVEERRLGEEERRESRMVVKPRRAAKCTGVLPVLSEAFMVDLAPGCFSNV